jgi:hypothetical protein
LERKAIVIPMPEALSFAESRRQKSLQSFQKNFKKNFEKNFKKNYKFFFKKKTLKKPFSQFGVGLRKCWGSSPAGLGGKLKFIYR